ncbi:hypothetical protein C2U54_13620 [Leclercia sp. LSNIH1]|nr:hypothetical protein C2U54_13620 [Leclercia sp. LSNIH1]POV32861.1 hypothetical protein C3388_18940 [Leclercia sp. LSNIH5]POW63562.1 hypothetical protein C3389_18960 [Leclercia sp. LSNIH2]HCH39470.1 hypothetical protein [Enterobacter sp.]
MAAFFISVVCGMPGGATLTRPTKATTARTVGRVRRSRHPANSAHKKGSHLAPLDAACFIRTDSLRSGSRYAVRHRQFRPQC